MELTNYFIDVLGTLSDCLTGQSQLYFFQYFSLFSFASLWKTLCKVKDQWGADLTPWTVSMKEGSEISHVTCCIIQMQIGSCNINCLNQFCKSCKFGGPGKRAAPLYIYICMYIYIYMKLKSHMIPQIVHDDCKFHCCAHSHWLQPPFRKSNAEGIKMWEPPYIWISQYTNEQQTSSQSQVNV